MTNNNETLLRVQDLKIYFRGNDTMARAVDGVSFRVRRGETVCLVGESGCGKTVSALAILGLIPQPPGEIVSGKVFFKGQDLIDLTEEEMRKIRGDHIAMVFQEPMTSLNPVFTIGDTTETIRFYANGWRYRPAMHGGTGDTYGENVFYLKRASDDAELRYDYPPDVTPSFIIFEWDVADLQGQDVYFQAVDGCTDTGFAWLGVAQVEEISPQINEPIYVRLEDSDSDETIT